MVALNVAGTVALVSVFFKAGADQSPLMLFRWALLFAAALLFPMYLSHRVEAELARQAGPVSPQLRRAAIYPVWVGIFTLAAAMSLLLQPR